MTVIESFRVFIVCFISLRSVFIPLLWLINYAQSPLPCQWCFHSISFQTCDINIVWRCFGCDHKATFASWMCYGLCIPELWTWLLQRKNKLCVFLYIPDCMRYRTMRIDRNPNWVKLFQARVICKLFFILNKRQCWRWERWRIWLDGNPKDMPCEPLCWRHDIIVTQACYIVVVNVTVILFYQRCLM